MEKWSITRELVGKGGRVIASSFCSELLIRWAAVITLALVWGCSSYGGGGKNAGRTWNGNFLRVHFASKDGASYSYIRWPSERRYVSVIVGAIPHEEYQKCPAVQSYASNILLGQYRKSDVLMGELCGSLYVFADVSGLAPGERYLRFFSVHESFHLAVQSYGFEVPLEYLAPVSIASLSVVQPILDNIASSAPAPGESCEKLEASLAGLKPEQLQYLAFKTWWEWPAEYYTFRTIFSDEQFDDYRLLRKQIVINPPALDDRVVYVAGVAAGLYLDKYAADREWRSELVKGENMLNIYLQERNCDFQVPLGPTVSLRAKRP